MNFSEYVHIYNFLWCNDFSCTYLHLYFQKQVIRKIHLCILIHSQLVTPFTKPLSECKALLHILVKYGFVKFILQQACFTSAYFFFSLFIFCECGKIGKNATQKKIGKNVQFFESGWRVEAGPTRKYVLMKKPQPDPIQPEFGPWGLNSTRLNPFFHPKNGFSPKNRVGFGRTN